jgi:hypothetical protein
MQKGVAAGVALLTSVMFLLPTATGHPYHLQALNEVNGGGAERVESSNWIAQSFLATSDFLVSRVALYVADTGPSDTLTLSIRPTALNLPASTTLTEGTVDGPPSAGWLDVDLDPYVPLSSADSYWIVARSSAAGGDGYDWWHSGTDAAYLDGTAFTFDGTLWSPRGRDFTFRVYGFVQPALSFSASIADATVREGSFTTATVELFNAGPDTAQAIWVNVTLPAEVSYVADDAAAAGGTLSGTYSYAFVSLAPGSRSFNITLKASTGVVNGTNVIVRVAINSTDHNGVLRTPFIRNLSIEIAGGPDVSPRPMEGLSWWLILIPLGLGGAAVFLVRRRSRRVVVDDVFVGDKHGLLLAHRSASMVQYQDEDLLVGMFTAIQDFVKDTFSRGVEEEFHALEFGERRVLIERGRGHFIAVVYRGENRDMLKDRVRNVSHAIDANFGHLLESWNGEVDAVKGIDVLLPEIWAGRAVTAK